MPYRIQTPVHTIVVHGEEKPTEQIMPFQFTFAIFLCNSCPSIFGSALLRKYIFILILCTIYINFIAKAQQPNKKTKTGYVISNFSEQEIKLNAVGF